MLTRIKQQDVRHFKTSSGPNETKHIQILFQFEIPYFLVGRYLWQEGNTETEKVHILYD